MNFKVSAFSFMGRQIDKFNFWNWNAYFNIQCYSLLKPSCIKSVMSNIVKIWINCIQHLLSQSSNLFQSIFILFVFLWTLNKIAIITTYLIRWIIPKAILEQKWEIIRYKNILIYYLNDFHILYHITSFLCKSVISGLTNTRKG